MRSSSVSTVPYIIVAVVRRPGAVRLAHDVEPLVGRRLAVAVEQLAHAIDQDLRAAAGNAVEPGRDQPLDHLRHGHAFSREMCRTSGGESACSLNSG